MKEKAEIWATRSEQQKVCSISALIVKMSKWTPIASVRPLECSFALCYWCTQVSNSSICELLLLQLQPWERKKWNRRILIKMNRFSLSAIFFCSVKRSQLHIHTPKKKNNNSISPHCTVWWHEKNPSFCLCSLWKKTTLNVWNWIRQTIFNAIKKRLCAPW